MRATSDDDENVVALFYDVEVLIESAYWLRSFSPEQPEDYISTPYLAKDSEGQLVAFAISRPRMLLAGNDAISAQVIHHLVFHPTRIFQEGQHEFLQFLLRLKDISFIAGAGLELTRILDRERFLRAGTMNRYFFEAGTTPPKAPEPILLTKGLPAQEELERLIQIPGLEKRFHFERSAQWLRWMHEGPAATSREVLCGYNEASKELIFMAASRTVQGAYRNEMQIVDALCPQSMVNHFAQSLAEKAASRKMDLYLSFFGSPWDEYLLNAGFQNLRPRWPMFWMIRDPKQRSLMNVLLRLDQWHFFPTDGEIDHF